MMSVINGDGLDHEDLAGRRSKDPLRGMGAVSSLRIVEMERTPGRTVHRHPHSEEIVYVGAGRGVGWIDGSTHAVGSGDVVHIPAGAAHATIPDEGQLMRLICFLPHPRLVDNLEDTQIEVS